MTRIVVKVAVLLSLTSSPALPNATSPGSCIRSLSPEALKIYLAAAPDIEYDTDMVALLRAKVTPMVVFGDMNMTTARTAATAASVCLRNLQKQHSLEIISDH